MLCREEMPHPSARLAALRGLGPHEKPRAQQGLAAQAGDEQNILIADLLNLTQHHAHMTGNANTASHVERQRKAVQVRL